MAAAPPQRAAIYARVSTLDQTTENQLAELRSYIETRGWTAREWCQRCDIVGSHERHKCHFKTRLAAVPVRCKEGARADTGRP